MQEPASNFLRLFPLGALVLFPGMELPLTVFEPRYVQLTSECTHAGEPFGVLLLKEGSEVGDQDVEPYEIGTTAHILDVTDAGHGRLSVMAVGGQRFQLLGFVHRADALLEAAVAVGLAGHVEELAQWQPGHLPQAA